ncbi:hypothetical protein BOW53_15980 [Solemya pervernicosa gill symbiont]|uniref:Bacterial virulence protein VirB8 domain-containing protein n=1 Tax=Solemya pervernicosa gill symbiont TaxID=642797 RepID=A0A1T2KZN6_9GAMM|nr:VirB8/TrbF family protein [Solemya pervernicosa gill symbiont]OOZ38317.1 hypothetical protein BOW53_15980 [Solemya pervernicosa gill symbiont]
MVFSKNDNQTEPKELNPYLAARLEWNERYGSLASSKSRAWVFASVCLLIAAISVVGVVYIGSQSKHIPYVVVVDEIGRPVTVGRADIASKADPRVIKAELASFFTDAFSVIADGAAQKQVIFRVYAHISSTSPSHKSMNEHLNDTQHNPFKRAAKETVSVTIRSIIQTTENMWQVEWTEKIRGRSGETIGERRMKGAVTILVKQPIDESTIMENPLGIYVQSISWSQQY